MGFGRVVSTKKYRSSSTPDMPLWLVQAEDLPNRLFITPAEKELVDLVRKHGELTKGDLVAYTDHSRTKITSSVNSLLQKKLILENPASEYTGGRRSKTFSLNGGLGYVAGVDIGATSMDLAVADFSHRILARSSEESLVRKGPIKVLGRMCSLLEKILRENGLEPANLRGIGIGVPGPVDFSNGMVVSPPIMPGWDRYPVIQTVQQWFPSANVVIDNDVNVMALGEINQGVGQGVNNLIFVKIGTGIGAGIISHGKIYRGSSGCAGDIGHISISKTGPLCHCGNKGCLEALAGGPAIAERALNAAQAGGSPILLKYYRAERGKAHRRRRRERRPRRRPAFDRDHSRERADGGRRAGRPGQFLQSRYDRHRRWGQQPGQPAAVFHPAGGAEPLSAAGHPQFRHRVFRHLRRRRGDRRRKPGHGLHIHSRCRQQHR